jgi:hypothetical protein
MLAKPCSALPGCLLNEPSMSQPIPWMTRYLSNFSWTPYQLKSDNGGTHYSSKYNNVSSSASCFVLEFNLKVKVEDRLKIPSALQNVYFRKYLWFMDIIPTLTAFLLWSHIWDNSPHHFLVFGHILVNFGRKIKVDSVLETGESHPLI